MTTGMIGKLVGIVAATISVSLCMACGEVEPTEGSASDEEQEHTGEAAQAINFCCHGNDCYTTCQPYRHPTSYQYVTGCSGNPSEINSVNCEYHDNTSSFSQCGTVCPSGFTRAGTFYSSVCGPGNPNAAHCERRIGYGQMGTMNWPYDDRCKDGLTPHNVESWSGNWEKAPYGWFSCWYNTPDVICHSKPKIYGYINVRQCYHRPDNTMVDYGCGCP